MSKEKETEKAKESLANAGKGFKEPPDYLPELHNRLALLTQLNLATVESPRVNEQNS